MTTQDTAIDGTWKDIKSDLSLVDDTAYTFQAFATEGIFLFEGAEPSDATLGIHNGNRVLIGVTPSAGNGIWVRTDSRKTGVIVATEGI
mgnify:CR=1 FL=1|tara:strand:+ start:609 stop:875 length:267 start_codon:yes stop_codon:yes gene_type:complete